MIHYHGLPITPASAALAAIKGGHAFVSFAHPEQTGIAVEACQSFALDNGAFSVWKSQTTPDWPGYYQWVDDLRRVPSCDFAVIPDVIGGTEAENDELIDDWPHGIFGVPVWHLHESTHRLVALARRWPRVALGSSREFATVGTVRWWRRMAEALQAICDKSGRPIIKLHGLRMLDVDVFSRLPLASADSCNIARNIGIDAHWSAGNYLPPDKNVRAALLRSRIEATNGLPCWTGFATQRNLDLIDSAALAALEGKDGSK